MLDLIFDERYTFYELNKTPAANQLANRLTLISYGFLYFSSLKTKKNIHFCIYFSGFSTITANKLYFTVCPAGWRWECPNYCGRHYKNKGHLQRHLQQECGVEPQYMCVICSKAFKRKESLKKHFVLVHKL